MVQEKGMFPNFVFLGLGLVFLTKWVDRINLWLSHPKNAYGLGVLAFLIGIIIFFATKEKRDELKEERKAEKEILGKAHGAVYCGETVEGESAWVKTNQRSMHTQIIGTTNAGKTESVILPWAIQDIQSGRGLLIIDGKADNSLLQKLYGYACEAGRKDDFRLFSLSHLEESFQFNPLKGGTAEEITERVFNSFDFENPHYRNIQYEVLKQILRIFEEAGEKVTFQRLYQVLLWPEFLEGMSQKSEDANLKQWLASFQALEAKDRENRTSGLITAIGHFAHGRAASLFNGYESSFTLDDALKNNLIVYFQLPVLLSPFLGQATGKLVLQSLQAATANRHRSLGEKKFFSVFLDDFTEYLYPGFVSILNKSRSANVGIAFAHQALGDITNLGDSVANSILTNSNIKVFMRGNDPESAEYFSKVIGTVKATKFTERQTQGLLSTTKTGEVSARDVEEFKVHPNTFKQELGVGEAIMIVPHPRGSKTVKIKFRKWDDLPSRDIPLVEKQVEPLLGSKSRKRVRESGRINKGAYIEQ